jgi:CubicO group peptidase (beta-lactamase class C family)
MKRPASTVPILLMALGLVVPASAAEIPVADPDSAGMSSAALRRVGKIVQAHIDEGELAGAITMVARHGKVVHLEARGMMDIEGGQPMREDAIFRIYSMTKAITTAAALMLHEEGRFDLDDPVAKHIPPFARLKVYRDGALVRPSRDMTVRDLMRHTSGLTYGIFGETPVDKLYLEAGVPAARSLEELIDRLAGVPLVCDPGSRFVYSFSTDVLGHLVSLWSGRPFDEFLDERVFGPLDMKDTAFDVPEQKQDRLAAVYVHDAENGGLVRWKEERSAWPPSYPSGGGGLASTARDYMRFLQMIAGGGELQGERLLERKTVELMTRNALPDALVPIVLSEGPRAGVGFGLGFSVKVADGDWDPDAPVGEFGWGGLASTHYWVSPKDDLVALTLEQTFPYSFLLEHAVKGVVYDAITD